MQRGHIPKEIEIVSVPGALEVKHSPHFVLFVLRNWIQRGRPRRRILFDIHVRRSGGVEYS